MSQIPLKPCAHCGSEAKLEKGVSRSGVVNFVYCTNPKCGISTKRTFPEYGEDDIEAASVWNKRVLTKLELNDTNDDTTARLREQMKTPDIVPDGESLPKAHDIPDGPEKAWLTAWRQYYREREERKRIEQLLSVEKERTALLREKLDALRTCQN